MSKREEIITILNCLMPDNIVEIWNSYVEWTGDSDSEIFPMREINSMIDSSCPLEILNMFYDSIHNGEFNPDDDFYHIDKYGDYRSCNCPCENNSPVRYGELADYILEYKNDFGNRAIAEIIKEEE